MTFKTLTEYAQEVMDNKNNPHILADCHLEIAAKFAMMSDVAKDLQIEKAEFIINKKFANEKVLSDKSVEALWLQTEGGKKEIRLKYEMRGEEKIMSAIKSSMYEL